MIDFSRINQEILSDHAELWKKLEEGITCGKCGGHTVVSSGHQCEKCGRILCSSCGKRWGTCEDHTPTCGHFFGYATFLEEPRKMTGSCKHNMSCPTCGFGWGQAPGPCDTEYYSRIMKGTICQ